jgi:hypothetical protein
LTASWFNLLFNFCISNLNFQPAWYWLSTNM